MNTLKLLQKEVIRQTGFDLRKKTRQRDYAYARFMYYKLCRDLTPCSWIVIGGSLGQDHATAMHGVKVFNDVIVSEEPKLMAIYYDIRDKFTTKKESNEFNDPVGYWKNKCHEVENKYYNFGEEYKKMMRLNLFMKGLLKQRGYQYKFMEEDMKEFEPM